MLQQTRVETVIPYYQRWMAQFPSVQALAQAPLQSVLTAWEGLGYYSRARNLHKAAQKVVNELGGQLPGTADGLRQLPGIGRYTAAAIASIAFGQDIATLDGNLKRVFSRVFNVTDPINSASGEAQLWALSEQNLPPGRASDYNQALMDLGAAICLPQKPRCLLCPLAELCQARALGLQELRPVKKAKAAIPHKHKAAAVIMQGDVVLLNLRPAAGLLGSLWEFPAAEVDADSAAALTTAILAEYKLEVSPQARLGVFRHTYTHFKLTQTAWNCSLAGTPTSPMLELESREFFDSMNSIKWVSLSELSAHPMGKVDRAIARLLTGKP